MDRAYTGLIAAKARSGRESGESSNVIRLGSHKTVLGFAMGVAVGVAITFFQSRLHWAGTMLPPEDWLGAGFAAGRGAMGGDSLKVFFARLDWTDIALVCGISFLGDVLVNHVSFYLGIRETKW